jgi:hypothetical protein
VLALVPVESADEQPAVESSADRAASDLADLRIEIPALEHDFEFQGHVPQGLSRRCEGSGVTTTCGAAPATDMAAPKAVTPVDTFPIPGPERKAALQ